MDGELFDAMARAAFATGSRRAALLSLFAGVFGLASLVDGEAAGSDRRHRRRTRRRLKRVRRKLRRNQTGLPGTSTCEGADGCFYPRCSNNGVACYCHINAQTLEPFCGGAVFDALDCGECTGQTTCVSIAEECGGGFACASPCG